MHENAMKKTDQTTNQFAMPAGLELVENSERLVSLTFGLSLYTDVLLSTVPDAVLACYEKFLSLCPADQLKFYGTENMSRHKPVDKRVLNMLKTWLKPGAPPRKHIALELKDGDDMVSAPRFKFQVWGNEKGSTGYAAQNANLVSMAFPPEWGLQRTEQMYDLVKELCGVFPFRSGNAGFCFECSRYEKEASQSHAWKKSMRHRGIDIFVFSNDTISTGHDGVKGVNWITCLGDQHVTELGGNAKIRKALSDAVELIPVPGGLLLKAGPVPRLGDTNRREFLDAYKAVYKLIAPLGERAITRYPPLALGGGDPWENTLPWLKRLADE